MFNASLIPVGSTIIRRYWTIPTSYTRGDEFETWDAAVTEARQRYAEALDRHRRNLTGHGSEEAASALAKRAVQVALRWYITYPDDRGSTDVEVERYKDVTVLRTSDETGTVAPR